MVKPSLAGLYLRLKLMPALQMGVKLLRLNCHNYYYFLFSLAFLDLPLSIITLTKR